MNVDDLSRVIDFDCDPSEFRLDPQRNH